ncbi:putative acetyltransferase [Stakelama sediminis]|uniref:Putative acetyltransferase n=1 Tax=Stakelama sediminis TaxID=463200 RepID=A0A840YV85_9SPHN|nr:GNAT family N-acetyltransferase [Stakelama sediminis]MBB5717558.1 putative acetyltransferase [Stakelama sediminis]
MEIVEGGLTNPAVIALLDEHAAAMLAQSPKDSCHFLDLSGLQHPNVTFWTALESGELLGCGALKQLAPDHGEIKSMRTAAIHLRKGVAAALLTHILSVARARGYRRVSLETGSGPAFDAAHALYHRFGFTPCAAFGSYRDGDSFSRFLTLELKGDGRLKD